MFNKGKQAREGHLVRLLLSSEQMGREKRKIIPVSFWQLQNTNSLLGNLTVDQKKKKHAKNLLTTKGRITVCDAQKEKKKLNV